MTVKLADTLVQVIMPSTAELTSGVFTSSEFTAAVLSSSVTTNPVDENALAVSEIQTAVTPTADEPTPDTEAQMPPLQIPETVQVIDAMPMPNEAIPVQVEQVDHIEPKSEPEEQSQDDSGILQDQQGMQTDAQMQIPQLTQLTQLTGAQFHPAATAQGLTPTLIEMFPQTILDHQQLIQHQQFLQQQQQQLQLVQQQQQQQQQQQLQPQDGQEMDQKSKQGSTPGGKGKFYYFGL